MRWCITIIKHIIDYYLFIRSSSGVFSGGDSYVEEPTNVNIGEHNRKRIVSNVADLQWADQWESIIFSTPWWWWTVPGKSIPPYCCRKWCGRKVWISSGHIAHSSKSKCVELLHIHQDAESRESWSHVTWSSIQYVCGKNGRSYSCMPSLSWYSPWRNSSSLE